LTTPFLTLNDFLLPPPLSALASIFMILGVRRIGNLLIEKLGLEKTPLNQAGGFIMSASLFSMLAFLMAWSGIFNLISYRILAGLMMFFGAIDLYQLRKSFHNLLSKLFSNYETYTSYEKIVFGILLATCTCLLLSTLGPVTDADSLDYHIGLPLDILRDGFASPKSEWLTARLVGLGEYLNLIGLAGGTDGLGACFQGAGLVLILITLLTLASDERNRLFVALCVLSLPVLLFLVPNQKPQLLPTAANTIALALIARLYHSFDKRELALAFSCIFFAMACKYSFILTGGILLAAGMIAAYKARQMIFAGAMAMVSYLILFFPLNLQKYLFYGDPLSPLLERFLPNSNPAVVRLYDAIRTSLDSSLFFPMNLIFPSSIGNISTILGVSVLIVVIAIMNRNNSKLYFYCSLCGFLVVSLFSQKTSRSFIEPYMWLTASVANSKWSFPKKVIFNLMSIQLVGACLMSIFAVMILFPGAVTSTLRNDVMTRYANTYTAMQWLDKTLPSSTVVLILNIRSSALIPRPFVPSDFIHWADIDNEKEREKILSVLKKNKVKVIVSVAGNPFLKYMRNFIQEEAVETRRFYRGTRNPWGKHLYETSLTYLKDDWYLGVAPP